MYPYIAETIPVYPVALAMAVVVSALVGAYGLWRSGLSLGVCVRLQLVMAAAGLMGAKLHSLIERGGGLFSLQQELTQGYRYPGAIVALVVVLMLAGRRLTRGTSFAALGDALAPSIGVGAALLRAGCLLYGCCHGVRSELPWAIAFPRESPAWHAHLSAGWIEASSAESLSVHPLQLYFVAVSLGAAFVAWRLQRRKRFDGQALLAFLALDGIGKAILETFRAARPPSVQLASVILGLSAAGGLLRMSTRSPASASSAVSARAIR